ncbi:MAG: glycosyltransferase family 39 protein [Acidobacteriia bacterium]|nr:glycosyltransferase family 39 protein [Terriglobia bacterium]
MRFPITDNRQPPLTFPAIITPTTVASSNSRFRRWAALFLLLLSAAVYLGTASRPALLDDADASHALVSREMLQRGDYVVMFLNGVRYLQKAPIHYWLVALDYKIFGPTEFAVRLPVALAMIGLTLMAFAFARHFFSDRAGLYAGLATATSLGMFMFTRIMIPEAIYALEFTAIFYLFLRAWTHDTGRLPPHFYYWGVAVLTACAVLTRGLIGVLFPVGTIVAFIILTRGWSRWRELHLLSSMLIFLAVAVPWHVIAEWRAPGFLWSYFINEHFKRALGTRWPPDYDATPLPIWWAAHLAWFFPWSLFLPLAIKRFPPPRTWWKHRSTAAVDARLLLFVWFGVVFAFFSLVVGSRMEYYAFGGWPAITILLGLGIARAEEQRDPWLPRLQAVLAFLGVALGAVLTWAVWQASRIRATGDISTLLKTHPNDFYRLSMGHLFDLTPQAFADLRTPALMAAACFSVGFVAVWVVGRTRRVLTSAVVLGVTMAVFIFAANLAYAVFEPHMSSRPLAVAILKHLRTGDQIAVYGEFDPASSVSFYTHRQLLIWNGRYNNLELGSHYPDAPRIFFTDQTFPAIWGSPVRVFLVVPQEQREAAAQRLDKNHTWLLRESGGKAVYVNHSLTPGQPSLAQSQVAVTHAPGRH